MYKRTQDLSPPPPRVWGCWPSQESWNSEDPLLRSIISVRALSYTSLPVRALSYTSLPAWFH